MTDWGVRSQSFGADSKEWLGSAFGVDMGRPGELDLSLFDLAGTFTNGFIPSGVVLARRTSDGLLGRYQGGTTEQNETQQIAITGTPTGGTFALTFRGQTVNVAFDATAAQVVAALETLSTVNTGDVAATGGALPGTPVVVEFRGQYQDQDVPAMTVNSAGLTGGTTPTAAITTPQAGGGTGSVGGGLDVAVGHLLMPVSTVDNFGVARTTGVATCAFITRGRVRAYRLPTGHGLDASARRALPHIEYLDAD
jgi:hypothetical protein